MVRWLATGMVSIESGLGGKVVAARVEWVLVVEVWAWASWFDQQFMCGLKREIFRDGELLFG